MYQTLKSWIQVGEALYQLLELHSWTCENRIGDKLDEAM